MARAFQPLTPCVLLIIVDGRKVASSIKALSNTTPVILLTGWGQRLIAANDIPAHVDKVLSKPPRLHELRAALTDLAK